jgi:CBS domain-containing protein
MAEKIDSILSIKDTRIWSMGPEETVYDAIALMADKGIGALLVISGGELVGVISERDYARKIILHGRHSKDTLIREIMTTSPMTVTPEHTIDDCMRIMTQHRIRHLPVLDQGALVGVISIGDLVNAIIAAQAHTIHQLHTYITGTYPA